jgi:hypothetical protein
MGTQVGNATPIEAAAAGSDESSENSGNEVADFAETNWTEEAGNDY